MRSLFAKAGMTALLVVGLSAPSLAANGDPYPTPPVQTGDNYAGEFTFTGIGDNQYQMQINGRIARVLDFRTKTYDRFNISQTALAGFGITDHVGERLNCDVQNNAWRSGSNTVFNLSEDNVRGYIANPIPRPLPEPGVEIEKYNPYGFRTWVNGSDGVKRKGPWLQYKDDNGDILESRTLVLSCVSLKNKYMVTEDLAKFIDRQWGDKWRFEDEKFYIDVSLDRANRTGDFLFYFEKVGGGNQFATYINGVQFNRGFFDLDNDLTSGDVMFTLSYKTLASIFRLTGDHSDFIHLANEMGIMIENVFGENGEGLYKFTVDRELFLDGGVRKAGNTTFLVRRHLASVC